MQKELRRNRLETRSPKGQEEARKEARKRPVAKPGQSFEGPGRSEENSWPHSATYNSNRANSRLRASCKNQGPSQTQKRRPICQKNKNYFYGIGLKLAAQRNRLETRSPTNSRLTAGCQRKGPSHTQKSRFMCPKMKSCVLAKPKARPHSNAKASAHVPENAEKKSFFPL